MARSGKKRSVVFWSVTSIVIFWLQGSLASPAAQAFPAVTFTVNFLFDLPDLDPGDGECDALGGPFFPGNQCTVRAAIQEANTRGLSDVIIIPSGTYTLTQTGAAEDNAVRGDLDVRHSMTITGAGAGSTILVGAGGWSESILQVIAGNVAISGITIRNGNAAGGSGGGVYNSATLTLSDSVISQNNASSGGGIYNSGALTLNNITVSGNSANSGGGITNFGTLVLNTSSVTGNSANSGAGLVNAATMTLNSSTVSHNQTGAGSQRGGGIYQSGPTLNLNNSTISNNSASGDGGGIAHLSGTANLKNVTIAYNTADSDKTEDGNGGGVYISGATMNLWNSLVAANADGSPVAIHPDCYGGLTSQGHNLVGQDSGCGFTPVKADLIGAPTTPIDPQLAPLRSNGGTGQTHALRYGSPAIDAGDPAAPGVGNACLAADARSVTRPHPGDGAGGPVCDIGAYETRSFTVNSPNDAVDVSAGNGVCASSLGECTLRAAVQESNALPGLDIIFVPFGTYTLSRAGAAEDLASTGDLDLINDVDIAGAGAAITIIQGGVNWLDRIFHVMAGVVAHISGFTIRNGRLNVSYGTICRSAAGGGICSEGTLTVSNSTITQNVGLSDGGGGIYTNSPLTIINSTISDNSAPSAYGGGIYSTSNLTIRNSTIISNTGQSNGGGIYTYGTLIMDNTTVVSNTVTGAGGGGIINAGTASLTSSRIISNTVAGWGGGLLSLAGTVTLSNTLVLSNSAGTGGGLYSQTFLTLTNSLVSANTAADAGGGIFNSGNSSGGLGLYQSTVSYNHTQGYGGGVVSFAPTTLHNSTISSNRAGENGGGLRYSNQTANLNNVTIANNVADEEGDGTGEGGGLFVLSGVVNFRNTLIAGNIDSSPVTRHPDCSGALASQGYNLVGDNTGCTFTAVLGDQVGTGASPILPWLGPLQDNGGPTPTHSLIAASLALDAGNNASCLAVDQPGDIRPADGDGNGAATCDIGATERCLYGDADGDRDVDGQDLAQAAAAWHLPTSTLNYDLDRDGRNSVADLMRIARQAGETCS
ncbi:MAG: hypothetical protein EXR62_16715 [Chloroflexi bacterium]|nr:hypothetical protein [Chloroflexota bacterium]